jgi:hypothetical protein
MRNLLRRWLTLGGALICKWRHPALLVLMAVCVMGWEARAATTGPAPRVITVWLIPSESGAVAGDGVNIEEEVNAFALRYAGEHVVVLNATEPHLRDQLLSRAADPALRWLMVKGQTQTLDALGRFAVASSTPNEPVEIHVRFLDWAGVLPEIRGASEGGGLASRRPDIVQLGSTWIAQLQRQGVLDEASAGQWAGRRGPQAPSGRSIALDSYEDFRLLFYWRRLPSQEPNAPAMELPFPVAGQAPGWDSLLKSLGKAIAASPPNNPRPPMALPIGLSANLLLDLVPVVQAGGSPFLHGGRVDLTSAQAMQVPRLLNDAAVQRVRVLAFPEASHQDAQEDFIAGRYSVVIEPGRLLPYLHHHGNLPAAVRNNLGAYLGITVPPATFHGGSELAVLRRAETARDTKCRDLAFALAEFLVMDAKYRDALAELGYLPSQAAQDASQRAHSIDVLLQPLNLPREARDQYATAYQVAAASPRSPGLSPWGTDSGEHDVLEGLQHYWRRIAETPADPVRLAAGARDAELTINRRIHWPTRTWLWLGDKGWVIVGAMVVLLLGILMQWRRATHEHRQLMLALRLYRAKIHSQLHAYGATLMDMPHYVPANELPARVAQYGEAIAGRFNIGLAGIVNRLCAEIEFGENCRTKSLYDEILTAFDQARTEFEAAFAKPAPRISLERDDSLRHVRVKYLSSLVTAVLQEWFLNCLNEIGGDSPENGKIKATLDNGRLMIVSPGPIAKEACARLTREARVKRAKNDRMNQRPHLGGGQGLYLISDLLWFGFRCEAHCRSREDDTTLLLVRLPLVKFTRE